MSKFNVVWFDCRSEEKASEVFDLVEKLNQISIEDEGMSSRLVFDISLLGDKVSFTTIEYSPTDDDVNAKRKLFENMADVIFGEKI